MMGQKGEKKLLGRIMEREARRSETGLDELMSLTNLREKLMRDPTRRKTGPLYQWLYRHHSEIEELRTTGNMWLPFVEAAIESGISIGTDEASRRRFRKTWQRVCAAKAREADETLEKSNRKAAKIRADERQRNMPSRLPASWRPEFVEPTAGSLPQPAIIDAPRGTIEPPQKNALATTIPCAVASSGDEVEPVTEERKTRAQVIFEGYTKRLADDANRKAGFIPREER